ncbi:Uridine 5'-monophosphate synthase [Balamuthia mandrillaris]
MEEKRGLEEVVLKLHEHGAIKLGQFKLKSGVTSPIYVDLRVVPSYPATMQLLVEVMWDKFIKEVSSEQAELVCGVPYGALPLASCVALKYGVPMIVCRKEMKAKDYGTKNEVEGVYSQGQAAVVMEDVMTSGGSIQQTVEGLRRNGLKVEHAVVFLDREQGGAKNLASLSGGGVRVTAAVTIRVLLDILKRHERVEGALVQKVDEYLAQQEAVSASGDSNVAKADEKPAESIKPTFAQRAKESKNSVAKALFELMERKKTNLAVAVDVVRKEQLLKLADELGSEICMLKTHCDIVEDFDQETGKQLQQIAEKHDFLIFEDRKFADIGFVAQQQYGGGPFRICDWANVVTCHLVAGESILSSMSQHAEATHPQQARGALLIAEMSTVDAASREQQNRDAQVDKALRAAANHSNFVAGLICQQRPTEGAPDSLLYCSPGVRIGAEGDGMGQSYRTPEKAVLDNACDVIIVGRGICAAASPREEAQVYRRSGWDAYLARLQQS